MDASPLVIVSAADDRFAMPLAVTFYSTLVHLSRRENALLFAVDAGVSEKRKRRVDRVVGRHAAGATLRWLRPEQRVLKGLLKGLAGNSHLPRAAYYRLLIPDLLPDDVEKAIYLDSDMLVLEDLRRLWALRVDGHSHLAVQDLGQPYVSSSSEAVPDYRALGLPAGAKYFNSGLMVMNLRRWRDESVSERVVEYARAHDPEDLRFLDQTGLNAVLAGQWGELAPRWNQMHGIYEYASWKESPYDREGYFDTLKRPYVVHYTYTGKPWTPGCRHPLRHLYLRYLKASGWFTHAEWVFWKARHRFLSFAEHAVTTLRGKAQIRTRMRRGVRWVRRTWLAR